MKIIERLNKIANNEISAYDKFKYENKIVNMEYLIDNCLFFSILNDEVEVLEEETLEEEKKIPEKLNIEDDGNTITLYGEKENEWTILDNVDVIVCNKINSIIDYLKSKGE